MWEVFKKLDNKTYDIPINDRRELFINNYTHFCESDCKVIDYNSTTQKVKCLCELNHYSSLYELGDWKSIDNNKTFRGKFSISEMCKRTRIKKELWFLYCTLFVYNRNTYYIILLYH